MPHAIGRVRALFIVLVVSMAVLIAAYSAVIPAFEAPDEPGHFHYIQALAAGHGLPVQGANGGYDPEFSQPPLYYSIEAAVARLVPPAGAQLPTRDRQNVFQNTTASGNVNLYSHPSGENFPWTGEVLQLHAMRLVNLLLAATTLLATYGIAVEIGLARWLALTAAATLAFVPQFDFIAGALNADNLIAALASVALYLLLRWTRHRSVTWIAVALGVMAGAAMLAKLSGLLVLPLVLGVMLWRAWRERSPSRVGHAALAGIVALAIAGWWYVRNLALYRDALGWEPMLHAIGSMRRPGSLTAFQAAAVLVQQRATALGVFGWNNLRLPEWVYMAGDALALLALVGLVVNLVCHPERSEESSPVSVCHSERRAKNLPAVCHPERSEGSVSKARGLPMLGRLWLLRIPSPLPLLALWVLLFAASLIRWIAVNTDAAQWRLLLPAYPAISILLVVGLWRLLGRWVMALPVGLGTLSLVSLLAVVQPAYAPEASYGGPIQHPLSIRFGDQLELAGYEDPQPRAAAAGQPVTVTLYWRALGPVPEDDIVDLAALDSRGQPGWKESTWPQEGRAPTSGWQPGDLVRDRHLLDSTSLPPGVWNIQLDVYRPREGAPRLPIDTSGDTIVDVGRFLKLPPQTSASAARPLALFQGNLGLLSHRQQVTAGSLQVGLQWRSTGSIDRDYTVFVHLLDGRGNLLAQSDSQPGAGRFPTSLLGSGVTIDDVHVLTTAGIASGDYQLEVGLYDAGSGQRLELQDGSAGAFSWSVHLTEGP